MVGPALPFLHPQGWACPRPCHQGQLYSAGLVLQSAAVGGGRGSSHDLMAPGPGLPPAAGSEGQAG